jgi:hypothetical protein
MRELVDGGSDLLAVIHADQHGAGRQRAEVDADGVPGAVDAHR